VSAVIYVHCLTADCKLCSHRGLKVTASASNRKRVAVILCSAWLFNDGLSIQIVLCDGLIIVEIGKIKIRALSLVSY
jgi:hypothetical protein